MQPARRAGVLVPVLVLVVGMALAACSGGGSSSSSSSDGTPPSTTEAATDSATERAWAGIDSDLAGMGPHVGFLAARVTSDGACDPIHEVAPSTPRPTGSQFKLYVLGALADRIAAGEISWDDTLTVREEDKSLGNGDGSLQMMAPGTAVTVEEAATKMISISDNTAADMLIGLVGRDRVEAMADEWMADPSANVPFLTTRQMILLHYVPGLADRFEATPQDRRADFLATSVDPLPLTDIGAGYTTEPSHIDTVEWFASPEDVCRAFAGLRELSTDPALAPLPTVLSQEVRAIGLEPSDWATVWYKGGSESGVLTLGWLATDRRGDSFVVEAMVSNPDAALADDALTDLVALARDAFALVR